MPINKYDIIIVGAGVVGCAIARELSKYNISVAVIDKNADVAEETSKANSGVVHAGFNVPTGTLKARTNVDGFFQIPGLAKKLNFPYAKPGKLVIGYDEEDLERLNKLKEQGDKNGCTGLSIINEDRIKELEPNVSGKYALYSKDTGIFSPYLFTIALAENALSNGVDFYLSTEVTGINKKGCFKITTTKGLFEAKWVINSAGLYADKVSALAGDDRYTIYPCRGEYFITDKDTRGIIKSMIYPLPNKDDSGLGVHITPTNENTILIGPSAEYTDNIDIANTKEVMKMLKYEASELVPEISTLPFIKYYAGVRPKLIHPTTKEKFRDFVIEESELVQGLVNLIGIESPGLTASPAIAKLVVKIIGEKHYLRRKTNFIDTNPPKIKFNELSADEKNKIISKDKDYGEIVCRCETITKYEVLEALNNPLGVKSLDAVKRRCRPGMGRCQGGFCTPRIVKILQDDFGICEKEILKNNSRSIMFFGKIKN